jgi:hypothetical protein
MKDQDVDVLLAILAVKMKGGQSVPLKQDVFAKGLKQEVELALAKGWLKQDKGSQITVNAKGKAKSTSIDVLGVTPEGEQALRAAADPSVLGALQQGILQRLKTQLEADRVQLRETLASAAAKAKPTAKKTGPDPKDFQLLSKKVDELTKNLQKLADSLTVLSERVHSMSSVIGQNSVVDAANPMVVQMEQAFANFLNRLQPVLPQGDAAAPVPPKSSLRDEIHKAYRELCFYVEFEDGLVAIPRLYHEVKKALPQLSIPQFHQELDSLWRERLVELKVINEVRQAIEPEKAIRQGDDLYYYILWRQGT